MDIIAYKNVFNREEFKHFTIEEYLTQPLMILDSFGVYPDVASRIKSTKDKHERNEIKRQNLPAVDLSSCGVLSIDIDEIFKNDHLKNEIVDKLSKLNTCFAIQETASGNIVALFRYECTVAEFPFLYYKLYLELTLLLSVSIDFLPDIGRLRYVSTGKLYHLNKDSETLCDVLKVEALPYINTKTNKEGVRKVIYGSR